MTNQHPITPPPELVQQRWNKPQVGGDFVEEFATFFARWGAAQELEACCEWVRVTNHIGFDGHEELRAARRPKPPSLKKQALSELDALENMGVCNSKTIRCALEALPND